jgi:hypothetical protein
LGACNLRVRDEVDQRLAILQADSENIEMFEVSFCLTGEAD